METLNVTRMVPVSETLTGVYLYDKDNKAYFLSVEQDDSPANPREEFCLSHMVCWMRRLSLGDSHSFSDMESFHEYCKAIKKSGDDVVIKPIYAYIHSGITISTSSFNDYFDSGLAGFVYVVKSEVMKQGFLSNEWKMKAKEIIDEEISLYDKYLQGDVYGYRLFEQCNDDWVEVDSCWGFFGSDIKKNGMLDQVGLELRGD